MPLRLAVTRPVPHGVEPNVQEIELLTLTADINVPGHGFEEELVHGP